MMLTVLTAFALGVLFLVVRTNGFFRSQNQIRIRNGGLPLKTWFNGFRRKGYDDIINAVNDWCDDRSIALEKYGHISEWDTSRVTCMKKLFLGKKYFNDDISKWNVSNVTNMQSMFCGASSFNQPLDTWNVSNVSDMSYMFCEAS